MFGIKEEQGKMDSLSPHQCLNLSGRKDRKTLSEFLEMGKSVITLFSAQASNQLNKTTESADD